MTRDTCRHNPKDTIHRRSQRISGPFILGRKYLGAITIQHGIHNKYNIIAAYTQPPRKQGRGMKIKNSAVHTFALKKNIPVYCPKDFSSFKTINVFKELNSDIVVVMGYGILLPENILNIPVHGIINIHLSLLPQWRGAAPIEHTILNGDKVTGVSIFQLTKKLDTGNIIIALLITNLPMRTLLEDRWLLSRTDAQWVQLSHLRPQ